MTESYTPTPNMLTARDIDHWNSQLLKLFVPLDVVLVLYMIIGIIGNSLVLFVYGFKMKTIKDGQYFIPYLAAVDFVGSIICALFGLSMAIMPVTYDLNMLCKMGWLFGTTTSIMSVFMLVIIAVQRYIKVCLQRGNILTLKRKRLLMICAFIISSSLSVPAFWAYDSVPFHSSHRNITGTVCGKINGTESLVYDVILAITASLVSGILILLYSLIGRTTYKYMKKGACLRSNPISNYKGSGNETKEPSMTTLNTELKDDEFPSTDNTYKDNPKSILKSNEMKCKGDNRVMSQQMKKEKASDLKKRNQKAISRITIMFMIITIIFLICFAPKFTIIFLETITPNFWENFSDVERVVLMFIHQGYIINNIANPFIYAFFDKLFRAELKTVFPCNPN